MAMADRYAMAVNATFQQRMETTLFKAARLVILAGEPTYEKYQVTAAKKVLAGLVPIREFCLVAVNDTDLGPLIDAGTTLTDNHLLAAASATVDVFAAGAI